MWLRGDVEGDDDIDFAHYIGDEGDSSFQSTDAGNESEQLQDQVELQRALITTTTWDKVPELVEAYSHAGPEAQKPASP